MNITDVRIKKLEGDTKVKAVASITIGGDFVVHDIKVIEGDKGLFISMPSKRNEKTKEHFDICHPINSDARKAISEAVITKYNA